MRTEERERERDGVEWDGSWDQVFGSGTRHSVGSADGCTTRGADSMGPEGILT